MALRVALVVFVALSATAQADVRITALTGPPAPIPPETSPILDLTLEADCSSLLARLPPGTTVPIPAAIGWTTQGDLYVTGRDHIDFAVQPCLDGAAVAATNGTFQLTAPRSTPALRPFDVTVRVALGDVQGLAGLPLDPANDTATVQASAAPNLVSTLAIEAANQACHCPEIPYAVRLENLGNTAVAYRFEATRAPPAEEGWSIRLPDDVVLDSPLTPGGSPVATATVVIVPPPGKWNVGSFQLAVMTSAADDDAQGATLTAGLLASNPDFGPRYESAPLPAPVLSGLLLLGLALLARRRA